MFLSFRSEASSRGNKGDLVRGRRLPDENTAYAKFISFISSLKKERKKALQRNECKIVKIL